MRIGVAATPDVAIPTLNWLLKSDHTIEVVITQPDKPAGRGRNLKQSVVADWATANFIRVLKPTKPSELIGHLEELDLVLTIGYGVLLPEEILNLPRHGFLNLHFSLLPAYRGAAPAQRALHNGEVQSGVTVFQLEKGMDTGPIYSQQELDIAPEWRSFELLREMSLLGPSCVEQAFTMINAGHSPVMQSGVASIAPKINKAEAQLNFSLTSQSILNAIRAFTYEPGAWSLWKGEPFKITNARLTETISSKISHIRIEGTSVLVGTGDYDLEITQVIPAGKKEMPAIDWARGARLTGGEIFG
jgi:methionyl-tRNA formyltransferase